MKLARVDHYRCQQPAGKWGLSTYVWIADDMSEEEFHAHCNKAAEKLLQYERDVKAATPVQPPGYGATILPNTPDHLTIGELKADYAAKEAAYKLYQEKVQQGRKGFTQLLIEGSEGKITSLWKEPAIRYELDWGHNHGLPVDYGETESQDYPPDEEENWL